MNKKIPPTSTNLRSQFLARLSTDWSKARAHYRAEIVSKVGNLYDRFIDEKLADSEFSKLIAEGNKAAFQQRLAELLLAGQLWDWDFTLSSGREGPDFFVSKNGQSAWIELTTPEPAGIAPSWLNTTHQGVMTFPHKEIALRYTSAIKEKHQKLVGNPSGKPGYLTNGVVTKNEPYVIAVNQHLLQGGFRQLNGISQRPVACEVLFGIGPMQLHFDRDTREIINQDHACRPQIHKNNDAEVQADSFLDPTYGPVSAVLALDLVLEKFITSDPDHFLMRENLSSMVYNPKAHNPLPFHWIPAQSHWVASEDEQVIEVTSM